MWIDQQNKFGPTEFKRQMITDAHKLAGSQKESEQAVQAYLEDGTAVQRR